MDAPFDYAQAASALANTHLPAYVSYVVHSIAAFDAMQHEETAQIVVRTRDGKIVKGKPLKLKLETGKAYTGDVIRNSPFDPACYSASKASLTTFESQTAEAIALQPRCRNAGRSDNSNATDFQTLYVEPVTHRPIAVVGGNSERFVTARLDERFGVTGGFVVPTDFQIRIIGSGLMVWLNVDARQTFTNYRFTSALP